MRRTFFALVLTFMFVATCARAHAQTTAATRASVPLPASDVVLFVDLKRFLNEAMPRVLASDATRAAQVNADIEQFKTRTGLDVRAFETLTVGARILKLQSGATKLDNVVAIARGNARTDAVVAAGRAAAAGMFTQQTYGGKTVYVFTINERIKVFGLARMRVSELAVAALDQTTLAVGDTEAVRSAIDAAGGRGRIEQSLLNPVVNTTDIIAFAGNIPVGTFDGVDTGLGSLDSAIASIRAVRGSLGTTSSGYQLTTILRTQTAAEASQLYKTIDALKQVAPGLIMAAGERWKFALGLVNGMKITTQGAEVHTRLDITQADIGNILRSL